MHEVMEPYDYVEREEYEVGRAERQMPDFMLEGDAYILRYIQAKNPGPFYATDYIVCIRGIHDARRGTKVDFEPVPLDGRESVRALGHIATNNEGIVITRNIITAVERGYFVGPAELYPPVEELEHAAEAVIRSRSGYNLL